MRVRVARLRVLAVRFVGGLLGRPGVVWRRRHGRGVLRGRGGGGRAAAPAHVFMARRVLLLLLGVLGAVLGRVGRLRRRGAVVGKMQLLNGRQPLHIGRGRQGESGVVSSSHGSSRSRRKENKRGASTRGRYLVLLSPDAPGSGPRNLGQGTAGACAPRARQRRRRGLEGKDGARSTHGLVLLHDTHRKTSPGRRRRRRGRV